MTYGGDGGDVGVVPATPRGLSRYDFIVCNECVLTVRGVWVKQPLQNLHPLRPCLASMREVIR
jgi:hypothetical protein